MLTPKLEKLVLCGKASFNTLSIGGSEKTILNVTSDRYIIITDIIVFHHLDNRSIEMTDTELNDYFTKNSLTQLSIFSDRSYNNFVIRNEFDIEQKGQNWHVTPKGHTKIDTYLIHNTDVSFNWAKSVDFRSSPRAVSPALSVARPVPFDYGKNGQNAVGTVQFNKLSTVLPWNINQQGSFQLLASDTQTNQLQFPVTTETQLQNFQKSFQYPIAIINYVEVFGELTNISATL